MNIIDRYIIRQYLLNFFIMFTVVMGLYVLLDLIINFDEFVQVSQRTQGTLMGRLAATLLAAFDYYLPQTMMLYVYMAGLLPVAAAGFTMAQLIRSREVVALLASGVSMYRIATPILIMGFAANFFLMIDQEFVMPRLAYKLTRGAADLKSGGQPLSARIHFLSDGSGSLFTARSFDEKTLALSDLTVLRRDPIPGLESLYGQATQRIEATRATWDQDRQGWRLEAGLVTRRNTVDAPSAAAVQPIDFVPSDLDPASIFARLHRRYAQMISLGELGDLIDRSAKTHAVDTGDLMRIRHCRFSLVLVNMLILAIGLPHFLVRTPAPLLVPALKAAAVTIGAWASGMIIMQMNPGFLPAAVVAWMPVAIYLPWAWYKMEIVET